MSRSWSWLRSRPAPLIGHGLPAPLHDRLVAGGWLRTAHRGLPRIAPGNSPKAIAAAAALGVDLVEVDLHRTADDQLALWHDDDLVAPGVKLPIARTTLAKLRSVDLGGGERIGTLAEAMDLARGRAGLMIDLKAGGLAHDLVATARRLDFGPIIACGHYWGSLRRVKALDPSIGVAFTLHRTWRRPLGAIQIERGHADAVTVNWRIIDQQLVRRYHACGVAILAWTVDDPAQMRRLLALGVNGLTSNRADLFAGI
jgi:glycerophosphoryl diester phosphodiesterase